MNSRTGLKIGKFDISADFFDRLRNVRTDAEYEEAKLPLTVLLRDMIVLEAEYVALENRFSYVAICDLFEPLEEGKTIPTYQIMAKIDIDEDGNKEVSIKAEPYAVEVYYFSEVNVTKNVGDINY